MLTIFVAVAVLALSHSAYAAAGSIITTNKYAWGNDAGWVNFSPTNSAVTVTDSDLTGYAWSSNDGWINLSPANGGVTNDNGSLGGFAWEESYGWVSFSGVTIDAGGTFHGEATGADDYAINFDCSACDVRTSWTPSGNTTASNASSPGAISPPYPAPANIQAITAASSSAAQVATEPAVPSNGSAAAPPSSSTEAGPPPSSAVGPITIVNVPAGPQTLPPSPTPASSSPSGAMHTASTFAVKDILRTHAVPIALGAVIAAAVLVLLFW